MRSLKGNDLFAMSRILKKMHLDVSTIKTEGKTQVQVGIDVIKLALEHVHLAQDEVNEFMGSLCGCTGAEFGEKPIGEVLQAYGEFARLPGVADFLSHAGQSTQ